MNRSAALARLSRDHQHALVIAQQLRRASPDAARTRFLAYWTERGLEHFQREEETLLPGYASHGDAGHPAVLRVLDEHAAAPRRPPGRGPLPGDLDARLSAHVGLEERELFPLIMGAVPGDELTALARALGLAGADQCRRRRVSAALRRR